MNSKKSKTGKTGTRKAKTQAKTKAGAASYGQSLAAAGEKSKSDKSRIAELETLATGLCDDKKGFRTVLELLQDTSESPQLRRAALRTLQAASFSVVAFNARRPDYVSALRALVRDPDLEIRQSVLGILARERDGHVQRLLLAGLEDPDEALVSTEKALQLLSYDVHAEAYPLARKIAKDKSNSEARREALRLLAADAGSASLFEGILRDKKDEPEFRRLAASVLQTLKPAALQAHAREIVLDDNEDDDVKATGLTALSNFGAAESTGRDEELNAKTSELKNSGSESVKRGAKAFIAKYRRE